MNMEKLKPWNWFKHEDDSTHQIPVAKQDALEESRSDARLPSAQQNQAVGSLRQLHQEMDRLFDDVWRSFGLFGNTRLASPASALSRNLFENAMMGNYRANLDVSGSDKEYEVSIDLPGLSEDDIQIELVGNALTVRGHKEETSESKDKQYYRVERSLGTFQRTLSLPDDADREAISANLKNGLLVIQIPRKPVSKDDVKRIAITS